MKVRQDEYSLLFTCLSSAHAQLKAAVRQEVITMVLATDMKQHFSLMGMFASHVTPSHKLHAEGGASKGSSADPCEGSDTLSPIGGLSSSLFRGSTNTANPTQFLRDSINTVTSTQSAGAVVTRASAVGSPIMRTVSFIPSGSFRNMQPAEKSNLGRAGALLSGKSGRRCSVPNDEACPPPTRRPSSPMPWSEETKSLVLKVRVIY